MVKLARLLMASTFLNEHVRTVQYMYEPRTTVQCVHNIGT